MKKEVIIAIFAGLSLGLIIAFGVRTAKNSLKNHTRSSPTPTSESSQLATESTNHSLLITTPTPDEIVTDSDINIVGSTTPNSMVGIVGTNGIDTSTVADNTGAFNAPVTLAPGVNVIAVDSYTTQGEATSTTFAVVFSTADLSATTSAKAKKS